MADFKMRGHILLAENEEKDNNKSLLTMRQAQIRDMVEVDEDAVMGSKGLRWKPLYYSRTHTQNSFAVFGAFFRKSRVLSV